MRVRNLLHVRARNLLSLFGQVKVDSLTKVAEIEAAEMIHTRAQ